MKICGLRTAHHAEVAMAAGADAVGVVMNQTSSRRATEDEARAVVATVRGRGDTVLVVNDMPADEAAHAAVRLGFDVLQLHGEAYDATDYQTARTIIPRVWRATSLSANPSTEVGVWGEEALLLDAPRAGSGERWDLTPLTSLALSGKWMIAGGLTPANVADVVATAQPWGVDVSSGVEGAPGEKDAGLITAFVANARG